MEELTENLDPSKEIKFKPLSNFILLKIVKKTKIGSILIPDTAKAPQYLECTVVRISEEKEKDGTPMVKNVSIGDRVVFAPYAQSFIVSIWGEEYVMVRETELLGIIYGDESDFVDKPLVLVETNLKLVN